MNIRDAIYTSLEMIEENLKSDMTVYAMSQKLGFSLYYFSRLFKGITGLSPKTYMLNRKISSSAGEILNSDRKIIDIAFDYGFGSPESYSRAFQKITGMNPSQLRHDRELDRSRLLQPITKDKIEHGCESCFRKPELVTLDRIQLTGIPFYYDRGTRNDFSMQWGMLMNNISMVPGRVDPGRYYQVQYWFEDQEPDSMFFFIACEVNSIKDIPVQFTAKILPAQKYLRFLHRGLSARVGYTYEYIYEKWLPETDYRLPFLYNFEYYGKDYKGPYSEESVSEIYIPVEV